jgi:hypothetical protein
MTTTNYAEMFGHRSHDQLIYGHGYTDGMVSVRNTAQSQGFVLADNGPTWFVGRFGGAYVQGWSTMHPTGHMVDHFEITAPGHPVIECGPAEAEGWIHSFCRPPTTTTTTTAETGRSLQGRCPWCEVTQTLTSAGKVATHAPAGDPHAVCSGSGLSPDPVTLLALPTTA